MISVKNTFINLTKFIVMRKKLLENSLLLFSLAAIFAVPNAVNAQTYNWTGGSSNFYSTSNWTSTQGSVVFDNATFKTVRTNATGASPVISTFTDWQPGIFDNTGGNLTINADFNVYFNDMLNGTVTVNSGAIFTCRNIIRVGRDGMGVLNINGTVRSLHESNFQSIFIGALGGSGTVNVNDGGLLSGGWQIEVGSRDYYPTGELNVSAGGTAEAYWVTAIGPNGIINVNGGTLNTGQTFKVGDLYLDNPANPGTIGATVGMVNINSGTVMVNQNNLDTPIIDIHANGKIMIDNGSLVIKRTGTDFSEIINGLVTSGQIVPAPDKQIVTSYDGVLTTVTAQELSGTKNVVKNNYSIYPNPAHDVITISPNNGAAENLNIAVINILGETVMQSNASNTNSHTLNISNLATGIYALKISNASSVSISKIIKK